MKNIPAITDIDKELEALYSTTFCRNTPDLPKIPKKFFSDEYLLDKDKNLKTDVYGTSIFHLATLTNQINEIPERFFKAKYLMTPDAREKTVMSAIANMNDKVSFKRIPQELITKENITDGYPVVCELAGSGNLDLLPKELLTSEILLTTDGAGNSAFILAARVGKFGQIPKEIITKDVLLHKDAYNQTLVAQITSKGQLNLLDPKWINKDIILNDVEFSLIEDILVYTLDNDDSAQLEYVVKCLNPQELRIITELYKFPTYPDSLIKIIRKELNRKIQLEALKSGLNRKIKEIEI